MNFCLSLALSLLVVFPVCASDTETGFDDFWGGPVSQSAPVRQFYIPGAQQDPEPKEAPPSPSLSQSTAILDLNPSSSEPIVGSPFSQERARKRRALQQRAEKFIGSYGDGHKITKTKGFAPEELTSISPERSETSTPPLPPSPQGSSTDALKEAENASDLSEGADDLEKDNQKPKDQNPIDDWDIFGMESSSE